MRKFPGNMAISFLHCFTHSSSSTSGQLSEKLKKLADEACRQRTVPTTGDEEETVKTVVKQVVISNNHLAILQEDGRLFRVAYSLVPDATSGNFNSKEKNDDDGASTSSVLSGSHGGSPRPEQESGNSMSIVQRFSSMMSSARGRLAGRRIVVERRSQRGPGRSLLSRGQMVPLSEVPEELVEEAMAVLQGKAREVVVRELQRTNLDVNVAVNNLLSRDDEDGSSEQEDGPSINVLPAGEELLSLLSSGSLGEEDLEELMAASSRTREGRLGALYDDQLLAQEIRSWVTLADRAATGGGPSSSSFPGSSSNIGPGSSQMLSSSAPIHFCGQSIFWNDGENPLKFSMIAGMASELLAVDSLGQLRGWGWSGLSPPIHIHPRSDSLNITGERVVQLAAQGLRATVVLESGRIAVWVDVTASHIGQVLEHPATHFQSLSGEKVAHLYTTDLFTLVVTETSRLFWWGLLPFPEREQLVVYAQDRSKTISVSGPANIESIVKGSVVSLRSRPIYPIGCKVLRIKDNQVSCGELAEDLFSMGGNCPVYVLPNGVDEAMEVSSTGTELSTTGRSLLGTKRPHEDDEESGRQEARKREVWQMNEVAILARPLVNLYSGTVMKVDGPCVIVRFPPAPGEEAHGQEEEDMLSRYRALKIEDLVLVQRELSYSDGALWFQDNPKRIRLPSDYRMVALGVHFNGVTVISKCHLSLKYSSLSLEGGRISSTHPVSDLLARFLLERSILRPLPLRLLTLSSDMWLLLDNVGGLYPLIRDRVGRMQLITPPVMPPVRLLTAGNCDSQNLLVVTAFRSQKLLPLLATSDITELQVLLENMSDAELRTCCLTETATGANTALHVVVSLCAAPPLSKKAPVHAPPPGLRDIMRHALALASSSVPTDSHLFGIGDESVSEEEDGDDEPVPRGPPPASACLDRFCSQFRRCPGAFFAMLRETNVHGFTPFMCAVECKAFGAALRLLDIAESILSERRGNLESILFPSGSHPDDNPIFMLCRADPCSFTWTGQEHIMQDIFECRSCGLVGSLCCCTECAFACHRGHDCTFKKFSPNAYCDCWEKCSCRALMDANQSQRIKLLQRLLEQPLATQTTGRGESLLGMLISSTLRLKKEHTQWVGRKAGITIRHHTLRDKGGPDSPPHDLEPSKFPSKALLIVSQHWPSVRAALMHEAGRQASKSGDTSEWPLCLPPSEHQAVLSNQTKTVHLDSLIHSLLIRPNHAVIEALVTTIVNRLNRDRKSQTALACAQKFIRSAVRVLVVTEMERVASLGSAVQFQRKKGDGEHSPIHREVAFIVNSLAPIATPEVVAAARDLILPVCMGISRPFPPSFVSDRFKVADDVFALPPADLSRQRKTPNPFDESVPDYSSDSESMADGGTDASDKDSDAGESEEMHTLGDASSTATVGSNLVPFLSDQDSSMDEYDSIIDEGSPDEGGDLLIDEDSYNMDGPFISRGLGHAHWALPNFAASTNRRVSRSMHNKDTANISITIPLLGQTFSMLIKLTVDALQSMRDEGHHRTSISLAPLPADTDKCQRCAWDVLQPVWQWLGVVMDSTEAQLRLGSALNPIVSAETKPPERCESPSPARENTRYLLDYTLSLLRAGSSEHFGLLPGLDATRLEHVAWVLDALILLLTHTNPPDSQSSENEAAMTDSDRGAHIVSEEQQKFFRRTESTTCLGFPPPSPFAPLSEALPLAERPHLLHPRQTRGNLFGFSQQKMLEVWPGMSLPAPPICSLLCHPVPFRISLTHATSASRNTSTSCLSEEQIMCENMHTLAANVLLGRWCMTVDLLGQVFTETLGKDALSIFAQQRTFETIEREFRREMDHLRSCVHRDLPMEIPRPREKLLPTIFSHLNGFCECRRAGTPQPLCVHRLKISFIDEPGEGSGVVRSFFTAFAEAVLSEEQLPELDRRTVYKKSTFALGDVHHDTLTGAVERRSAEEEDQVGELDSLFFQPGKPGQYSIRVGPETPSRINAYRNVGRVIGMALLVSELMPIPLCRHIFKYLLDRRISWHDLAFFDPVMYEGLRKLIVGVRQGDESFKSLDLTWRVTLGPYEGGSVHNLSESAADDPVDVEDVCQYVQKYAELRLVKIVEGPLKAMRAGLNDVLPGHVLEGVTAEELRMLLCGCQQVELETLRKITTFTDESKKSMELVCRFKMWFWWVIDKMTQRERQDLLYFWTSSPAIPSNIESYMPPPSVTIRPADDQHLPTANTCISRIYIPLYSSRGLIRSKLHMAIKIKTFGFI